MKFIPHPYPSSMSISSRVSVVKRPVVITELKTAQKFALILSSVLLLLVVGIFFWIYEYQKNATLAEIRNTARLLISSTILARDWNADYGGVYVLKRPGVESNPYLTNPDISDSSGHVLTLRHHATMVREMSAYAERKGLFKYHISSLNPLNPANAPSPVERNALESFNHGDREFSRFGSEDGKQVFHLVVPLVTTQSCLPCHEQQGYKVGDIRGGISLTLPVDDIMRSLSMTKIYTVVIGAGASLLLLTAVWTLVWRLAKELGRTQKLLLEKEKMATVGVMTATLSHEINNPLQAILLNAELLAKRVIDSGSTTDALRAITESAERIHVLVKKIQELKQVKTKPYVGDTQMIDVDESVKELHAVIDPERKHEK